MGFPSDHPGEVGAASTSGPVHGLLAQLQTELLSLVMRREDLARRIRSAHQVTRGLREISSAAAFTRPCAEASSPARDDSVTALSAAKHTLSGRSGRHLRPQMQNKTDAVNPSLQRACRIALLEGEGPLSMEEICTRIVRRGSFLFANPAGANAALLRVLNAMAQCGEVHLIESARGWSWERVALKDA